MKYLLDTNVCIDVLRGNSAVIARFKENEPRDFVLTTVTEFELFQGAARADQKHQAGERSKVELLLSRFKILPFSSEHARAAAIINADLLNRGTPIGIADVFIGATAQVLGVPVVTSNARDFRRIKGLELIDWR